VDNVFMFRRLAFLTAVTALTVFGAALPAQASQNIPWLYTLDHGGKAYFDADLSGSPGVEKLTVCDILSDGHGVVAKIWDAAGNVGHIWVQDPSHDDICSAPAFNMFPDESVVYMEVCEYAAGVFDYDCSPAILGVA
jgi:hypothetical protein